MNTNYRIILLVAVSILTSTIIISGCTMEDGKEGINGPAAYEFFTVNGVVLNMNSTNMEEKVGDTGLSVAVNMFNVSNIPNLKLDSFDLPISLSNFISNGSMEAIYYNMPIPSDSTVRLQMKFTNYNEAIGYASSDVAIPAAFTFDTSANNGYINYSDTLRTAWSESNRASFYYVEVDFDYNWTDTLAGENNYGYHRSFIVEDEFYIIPSSVIFPDTMLIEEINTFDGSISIYALSGSFLDGSGSNISGNATGTFMGATYGGIESYSFGTVSSSVHNEIENDKALHILHDLF